MTWVYWVTMSQVVGACRFFLFVSFLLCLYIFHCYVSSIYALLLNTLLVQNFCSRLTSDWGQLFPMSSFRNRWLAIYEFWMKSPFANFAYTQKTFNKKSFKLMEPGHLLHSAFASPPSANAWRFKSRHTFVPNPQQLISLSDYNTGAAHRADHHPRGVGGQLVSTRDCDWWGCCNSSWQRFYGD